MASRAAILRAARAGSPGAGQPTAPPQGSGSPWIGQLPSYTMEPGVGAHWGYGPFLPRPTETFTQGAFGPMAPILPVPVDTPGPGLPRAQPRRWQPYVGYNLPIGQPGTEGYKLASFSTLTTLSQTYSILRTCLERRKAEIRSLDWDIVLTSEAAKAYQGDRKAMRDFGERQDQARKWFRRPDPNYFDFSSWLYALTDQLFTIDAVSLYMCPVKGRGLGRGLFGSDLDCLWLIDGSSIRPLMGLHGEVPAPPAPSAQQYEYGVPRADLTTMLAGLDLNGEEGALKAELRGDQLIYQPFLPQVNSPYGFSLTEQALIPIMTGLRKQAMQLEFFTDSTTPRVYISPGDTTMTPNQLRELQDALNAVAGDIAWAFKVQVLPPGSKVEPVKNMAIVDQADEWIANEVCMVCDINPMELGMLPKVSTVASPFAAREMAQANRSIKERTATRPTLAYLTGFMNFILQQVCGQDDLRFVYEGMEETQDRAAVTDMGIKAVQSGIRSIDEVREELHLPPWGLPETSSPIVFTQMGPVPLAEAEADTVSQIRQAVTGAHDSARAVHAVDGLGRKARASGQGGRKALPAGTSGQGRMNGAVVRRQARRGGALAPAHATAEGSPGHSGASTPRKSAAAELGALEAHLCKGMPLSEWVPQSVPGHVMATIAQDLESGLSPSWACKNAAGLLPKAATTSQQTAAQQQAALAAQYQAQIAAAFAAALAAAAALVAAFIAGTLAVTAAVLAGMILAELRRALLEVLTGLWSAAWRAGAADAAGEAGGHEDAAGQRELDAFLETFGRNWAGLISQTGDAEITRVIAELAGSDPQAIVDRVAAILDIATRAEMIAVTEVTRAWSHAMLLVMRAAGLGYKRWITRNDSRVCVRCRKNQAQGAIPVTQLFSSGDMVPPAHPRCRCRPSLALSATAKKSAKVLRREVGLNGQETWTQWEPQPDASGGRIFYPHRADGTQFVPQGGYAGVSPGGEPPRWDGSEPFAYTERAPDADDDAAYGQASGLGAPPRAYWPASYMDGYWPSPAGHGMGQPGGMNPTAPTGVPPNGVGKAGDRARRRLEGAPKASPDAVYRQMRRNFPAEAIGWIRRVRWAGPVEVPLTDFDFSSEKEWAAHHEQAKVDEFARQIEAGQKVNPVVGVIKPGHNRIRVTDGHHRLMAYKKLGRPAVAYVAFLPRAGTGPADRTYLYQFHSGSSPENKSFTAGALGGQSNVSGLTPFNLAGGSNAPANKPPYVAGLLVRAADTGRVLMLQRAVTENDPAAGLFEWPGGHAEDGEGLLAAALREFSEEVGCPPPAGRVTGHWESPDGIYAGFVLEVASESDVPLGEPRTVTNPDGDQKEQAVFWDPALIEGNPAIRTEVRRDWPLVQEALAGTAAKSAQTPYLSTHHAPIGREGVWHSKHPPLELPPYIQNIRNALMRDGHSESEAHALAVAAVERWRHGGKDVKPEVQRASQEAYEQWEELRRHHP